MFKGFLWGLTLFLFSCNNSNNSQNTPIEPLKENNETYPAKELVVDNGEEDGWGADIRLSIVSATDSDTAKDYKVLSSYKGRNLGLLISIPKAKEGSKGFATGIAFKSIGTESDYFLQTLSTLYKQKVDTSLKFISSISVAYVNLKEFAKSLGAKDGGEYTTPSEYKLFFEGTNDEDYAELYVNINSEENWIELREKDEEYRPAIINFLKK